MTKPIKTGCNGPQESTFKCALCEETKRLRACTVSVINHARKKPKALHFCEKCAADGLALLSEIQREKDEKVYAKKLREEYT